MDGHRSKSTIDRLALAVSEEHNGLYMFKLARAAAAAQTSVCRALSLEILHDPAQLAGSGNV